MARHSPKRMLESVGSRRSIISEDDMLQPGLTASGTDPSSSFDSERLDIASGDIPTWLQPHPEPYSHREGRSSQQRQRDRSYRMHEADIAPQYKDQNPPLPKSSNNDKYPYAGSNRQFTQNRPIALPPEALSRTLVPSRGRSAKKKSRAHYPLPPQPPSPSRRHLENVHKSYGMHHSDNGGGDAVGGVAAVANRTVRHYQKPSTLTTTRSFDEHQAAVAAGAAAAAAADWDPLEQSEVSDLDDSDAQIVPDIDADMPIEVIHVVKETPPQPTAAAAPQSHLPAWTLPRRSPASKKQVKKKRSVDDDDDDITVVGEMQVVKIANRSGDTQDMSGSGGRAAQSKTTAGTANTATRRVHRLRRIVWCMTCCLLLLAAAVGIALMQCGVGFCTADKDNANVSSTSVMDIDTGPGETSSETGPGARTPIAWRILDRSLLPFSDRIYSYVSSGKYGSGVSVSDDGSRVVVTYGEQQDTTLRRYTRRRNLETRLWTTVAEVFECTITVCFKIADYTPNSPAMSSASAKLSGDGSRLVVEHIVGGQSTLILYSIDLDSVDPLIFSGQFAPKPVNRTMALNYAGDVVAVLDQERSGDAALYIYDDTVGAWKALGQRIGSERDESTVALSLSSSGVVVGVAVNTLFDSDCFEADDDNSEDEDESDDDFGASIAALASGHAVRMYELTSNGDYDQIGEDITGAKDESMTSERSLAMSGDGNVVAVGITIRASLCDISTCCSPLDRSSVKILRRPGIDEREWETIGNVLVGVEGEAFGESVSLNKDGTTVVIGASLSDPDGESSGRVLVYEYDKDSDQWDQTGPDLRGNSKSSFGRSVGLSNDGFTVVVGAPSDQTRGTNAGAATVFRQS